MNKASETSFSSIASHPPSETPAPPRPYPATVAPHPPTLQELTERAHQWKTQAQLEFDSRLETTRIWVKVTVEERGRERGEQKAARIALEVARLKEEREQMRETTFSTIAAIGVAADRKGEADESNRISSCCIASAGDEGVIRPHPYITKLYAPRSANFVAYEQKELQEAKKQRAIRREQGYQQSKAVSDRRKKSTGTYETLVDTLLFQEDESSIEEDRKMYRPGGRYDAKSLQQEATYALEQEKVKMGQLEIALELKALRARHEAEWQQELDDKVQLADLLYEASQKDLEAMRAANPEFAAPATYPVDSEVVGLESD